ncbi:transposable element Tcb2 transposase [Trichonephila clavipes]|nr:transposable element Tcb2 transposase [Trichonephila clavipes]
MINGRTRLHVVANGTMTGQRYIDEVLLPHVRLFGGAVDLNPIENVWDVLGRQVAGQNYPPTNKNTLIRALTEEWDKLSQQLLDNVVQSMALNRRCFFGLLDCKNSPQSHIWTSLRRGHGESGVLHSARWHDGDWMIDGIREAWLRCFVWMVNLEKFFDLAESLVTALNNFTSVQPFLIYPSLTLLSF